MNVDDQACFDQTVRQVETDQFYAMLRVLLKHGVERGLLVKPLEPRVFGPTSRRIVTLCFIVFAVLGGFLDHTAQAGVLFLFGLFWLLVGRAMNRKYQRLCLSLGLEP